MFIKQRSCVFGPNFPWVSQNAELDDMIIFNGFNFEKFYNIYGMSRKDRLISWFLEMLESLCFPFSFLGHSARKSLEIKKKFGNSVLLQMIRVKGLTSIISSLR